MAALGVNLHRYYSQFNDNDDDALEKCKVHRPPRLLGRFLENRAGVGAWLDESTGSDSPG